VERRKGRRERERVEKYLHRRKEKCIRGYKLVDKNRKV
jgi:hypothetical protein